MNLFSTASRRCFQSLRHHSKRLLHNDSNIIRNIADSSKLVATRLKGGHTECVYNNALAKELGTIYNNDNVHREFPIPYTFIDSFGKSHMVGNGRADIVVIIDQFILSIEVKVANTITERQKLQCKKYARGLSNIYYEKGNVFAISIAFSQSDPPQVLVANHGDFSKNSVGETRSPLHRKQSSKNHAC